MTPDHDSRIVFYRYRNGPIRRAVVRPERQRLVFVGVPDVMLHEVVIRLY